MPITFQVTSVPAEQVKHYKNDPFNIYQVLSNQDNVTFELIESSIDTCSLKEPISMGKNSFVPDDIWLAITTQFSNYVNKRSEELREKFVDFEGKKHLTVYGDGTLMTADYNSLILRMTSQISMNIKDPSVREWIIPDFTTTTQNDKMVGAVVLMAAMKNYFSYCCTLCCNLPSVTLLGEVEDWINIRERANRLLEFEANTGESCMKKWCGMLFPILDQFVETIKGNPDKIWWNRIVNYYPGGSGPSFLSGWITAFCVFSDKGIWDGDQTTLGTGPYSETNEWPFIDTSKIPRGYVSVPILVIDNGVKYETEMFAGHMAADLLERGTTLQPRSDWTLFQVKRKKSQETLVQETLAHFINQALQE